MLVGLILCLVSFADLRKRRPIAANILLLAAGLLLALPVYGWFEPAPATGVARICFAIVAARLFRHLHHVARRCGTRPRLASVLGHGDGMDASRRCRRLDAGRRQPG